MSVLRPLRILLLDVNHVTLETSVNMLEYPLGLLYVGTAVKNAFGARVDVRIESYEHREGKLGDAEQLLREWAPDVLGLRCLTMGRRPFHALATIAKECCGVRWVLGGGPHASDDPADVLANDAFDAAVIGEGERTAVELIGRILRGRTLAGAAGTAARGPEGVVWGSPRPPIEDLDTIPLPDHELVDFQRINKGRVDFSFRRDVPHANLFTSRGCPYHCLYCHQIFGKETRTHSAARVLIEVKRLHDRYGITRFQILDDIFNLDRARAMEFFDAVVRSGMKLTFSFPNGLRGDRMDSELIDAMWKGGVRYVAYAVESASPRIQKLIRKRMHLEHLRETIQLTTARGIVTKGFFMLGFPTETEAEARATIAYAEESDLVQAMFFTVVYFPGTPLFRLAETVCDMGEHRRHLEDDYVRTREGPYAFRRDVLDAIKTDGIRRFFFSRKRLRLAFDTLPNFFAPRDIDAALLVTIISSGLREEEIEDAEVRSRLHRYFLVAERFSDKVGFFV